ncbi:Uncharacterised protein [Mycobacterium tuberculosis]|nr:Uncharacterised protein [Mycobacterium tuberculosis]
MTPMPIADRNDTSTEPIRYSGAMTARNRATRIRKTIRMVAKTMNRMSPL